MPRFLRSVVVAGGVLIAAGCGGDDESAALEPDDGVVDGEVTVLARDIEFDREEYGAEAGPVQFTYGNEGNILHSLVIEGVEGFRLVVTSNGVVETGTVELEAGEYVVFCDIAGHRDAGMVATLTVE